MESVNFLEAVKALADGECKEIETERGARYCMKDGIIEYSGIGAKVGNGISLSSESFLDRWKLISVKEKMVIEDVGWFQTNNGTAYPRNDFDWVSLLDKPKMKMTLEWEE